MLDSFIDISLGFWGGSLLTAFMLLVVVPYFIKRKAERKAIRKKAEEMIEKWEREGKNVHII